jgi:hypothetical protein
MHFFVKTLVLGIPPIDALALCPTDDGIGGEVQITVIVTLHTILSHVDPIIDKEEGVAQQTL